MWQVGAEIEQVSTWSALSLVNFVWALPQVVHPEQWISSSIEKAHAFFKT
jgi:hypothetical protein